MGKTFPLWKITQVNCNTQENSNNKMQTTPDPTPRDKHGQQLVYEPDTFICKYVSVCLVNRVPYSYIVLQPASYHPWNLQSIVHILSQYTSI
jgi:hypothetical protein